MGTPGGGYAVAPMYAVVRSGGKQHRVRPGDRIRVERITDAAEGAEVVLEPVLISEGGRILATSADLAGARVTARVLGEVKGPKITGFTYKPKTRYRRRWGHRQRYTTLEITGIEVPANR